MTQHDHRRVLVAAGRRWFQAGWPWWLAAVIHAPAVLGVLPYEPSLSFAGLAVGGHRWLAGWPWIDGNVGVTTEALGVLAARSWLHGIVPWWNHFSGIGLPLIEEGQTTALFLPFGLLLALPHGVLWLRLVLLGVAGAATRALLHRLGVRGAASVAGAVFYECNLTFAFHFHGPAMPVAFLPLLLLGIEQARERGPLPVAAIAGTAWTFLAGFPETAALDLLFAGWWAAVRLVQGPHRLAFAARVGGAVFVGLLLAAPAIVPFLAALPREWVGPHAGPVTGWRLAAWGTMLFPFSQGGLLANVLDGFDARRTMWQVGGGLVLPVLALALAGVRGGWGGARSAPYEGRPAPDAALRWGLAGWLLLSGARVVDWPPAVWLIEQVPLLRQATVRLYAMPGWAMAGAVVAALALNDWMAGRRLGWGVPLAGSLGLGAAALAASASLVRHANPWEAGVAIAAPLGVLAAVVVLTRRPAARWAAAAVVGLCGAYVAGIVAVPALSTPRGVRLDRALIRFLAPRLGTARVASTGPLWPNYGAAFGVAELNHNALPLPQNWADAVARRFGTTNRINFAPAGADLSVDNLLRIRPALEALAVRYVLTWSFQHLPAAFAGAPVYADGVAAVYRLGDAAPYVGAPGCVVDGDRDVMVAACAAASVLTRRELAWPGWHASVDGAPVAVAADGIFQTVALPAGRHGVRFWYAPPWAGWAWAAALVGAAAAVFCLRRPGALPLDPAKGEPLEPTTCGGRL